MSKKLFDSTDELVKEYQSGKSSKVLAEKHGTNTTTIRNTLKRVGVELRTLKEAHKFRDMSGDKNPNYGGGCLGKNNGNWKGGVNRESNLKRNTKEHFEWKFKVLARDKYECQLCHMRNKRKLVTHHIINWRKNEDLRFAPANGITLCNSCHGKVSRKEEDYITLFKEIIRLNN